MNHLPDTAQAVVHHLLEQMHDTLVLEVEDYLRVNGFTKTQFAEKIGVSKGYLSQFLNGRSDHKLSRLVSISLAIGKHPHFVFSNPPPRPYSLPEIKDMHLLEDESTYGLPPFLRGKALPDDIEAFAEVDELKASIDALRPFPDHLAHQLMQKFRYAWNYHSNALEGNRLTYGETITLILHGLTAKGKPLKDHLDVKGHENAVQMMLDMIKGERNLSQHDLRQLHQLLLKETYQRSFIGPDNQRVFRTIRVGEYKRQPNHVLTIGGIIHHYANPGEVPSRIASLLDWYNKIKDEQRYHPLLVAAIFHHEFVAIHPFDDGNGRMGRILMNFTLMRHGFPPIVVEQQQRSEYYDALSRADSGDYSPLVTYLTDGLLASLRIQTEGLAGGPIEPYRWDGAE